MSTKVFNLKQSLARDINCLASVIMVRMCDKTIALQAKGIAQYMLLCKKIPLSQAITLMRKKSAPALLAKLFRGQSEFLGPTPRSVGIDLISEISASKIQQSLDVKHIKKNDTVLEQLDRIRPHIKNDILYTHPTRIWVRCYISNIDQQQLQTLLPQYNVLRIAANLYEIYGPRSVADFSRLMVWLENSYEADLIFCSELIAFIYNPQLFLSNFVKFMWCYTLNRDVFNPTSYTDLRTMLVYMTQGLLFLNTNNLSNMPRNTHGPLIACTGERPRTALSKFQPNTVYINEGSRALQTFNKPSDFGTTSNFMEIIMKVNISPDVINNII
jgi:hypothetical protein